MCLQDSEVYRSSSGFTKSLSPIDTPFCNKDMSISFHVEHVRQLAWICICAAHPRLLADEMQPRGSNSRTSGDQHIGAGVECKPSELDAMRSFQSPIFDDRSTRLR